jgi:large conductance mechanosensitive channel protein
MSIDPEQEFEEYKKFAFNRNMMGVAIGLILATAFQKTVSGISDYLIMPIVNYLISDTDGDWRLWSLEPVKGMKIEIGRLCGTFIDFIILTLVLYFIWSRIMKQIWPDIELDGNKNKDKPLEIEVICLKKDDQGQWKVQNEENPNSK